MRKPQIAALVVSFLAALAGAGSATGEPVGVAAKRAQAQSVLNQVSSLDASLSHAIEAYNLANEQLKEIRADLHANEQLLAIAGSNLKAATNTLATRLVAIYTSEQSDSTLDVLVGSQSLEDLLDGLETVSRVSDQDRDVLAEVTTLRSQIRRARARLQHARARQDALVAERASHKASIEGQLANRRQLLSSIKSDIASMQAAEQRRQAELARQARVRASAPQPFIPELASADRQDAQAAPEVSAIPAPGPAKYGGVVGIAMQYLGIPYLYGGSTPSTGFDCSGFIMYVYAKVGVSLPHNAAAQYGYGTPVDRSQLQPGDLVFFNGLGHNGIYIGGGSFIHSPHTGDVVKISSISGWYSSTWVGARRL